MILHHILNLEGYCDLTDKPRQDQASLGKAYCSRDYRMIFLTNQMFTHIFSHL